MEGPSLLWWWEEGAPSPGGPPRTPPGGGWTTGAGSSLTFSHWCSRQSRLAKPIRRVVDEE